MKAIAKHDCSVTLSLSLESISLNRASVKKGDVLEYPVHRDTELKKPISDTLGDRCVIFQDKIGFIITYSKDFDYTE